MVAYVSLSLVLKFDPPISRLFVLIAFGCVLAVMFAWRSFFYFLLTRPAWRERIRQRVAVLGWNDEARALAEELAAQPSHPYRFCGAVTLPGDAPAECVIGPIDQLEVLLRQHQIDVLIATRTDTPRDQMIRAVEVCERTYVEWKIIPSSFQILLSGLRLQSIGPSHSGNFAACYPTRRPPMPTMSARNATIPACSA
jgi:FlaA1/EpsC-like NDP-sugar epimerase